MSNISTISVAPAIRTGQPTNRRLIAVPVSTRSYLLRSLGRARINAPVTCQLHVYDCCQWIPFPVPQHAPHSALPSSNPAAIRDEQQKILGKIPAKCFGQRCFGAYGPRTWNRLPTAPRSPELSLASFKRQLKTHSSVPALDSAGCSCGCRVPSSGGADVTVQRLRRGPSQLNT